MQKHLCGYYFSFQNLNILQILTLYCKFVIELYIDLQQKLIYLENIFQKNDLFL